MVAQACALSSALSEWRDRNEDTKAAGRDQNLRYEKKKAKNDN